MQKLFMKEEEEEEEEEKLRKKKNGQVSEISKTMGT